MLGQWLEVESEQPVSVVRLVSAVQRAGQADRDHRPSIPLICHSVNKHITGLLAFQSTNVAHYINIPKTTTFFQYFNSPPYGIRFRPITGN